MDIYFNLDFPGGSDGKASVYNVGDLGSIPGSGRSPGEGNGNPLQYYCLENPMEKEVWWAIVHETLESPLDCKEIQPVHSEGDQPWDYFGRNDAKAETPVLLIPHAKG